jgi:hypothetical protein
MRPTISHTFSWAVEMPSLGQLALPLIVDAMHPLLDLDL